MRFRRHAIALVSDVSEMYLQVSLHPEDRPLHRFLWRDCNLMKAPEEYEFSRVVFGVTASPFMAQYVSQQNARKHQDQFPRAAEVILKRLAWTVYPQRLRQYNYILTCWLSGRKQECMLGSGLQIPHK